MKKLLLFAVLFLIGMLVQAQTCSAPISMTIMNGNMYRFYTDTVPGIQSYAWIVTTFEDDTATSTGSFSSTPSAYFSGNQFISPDYVEACLTLTFEDGCVASSCDTFVYCDAGFTYALNEQYALTLTPDFPAGYMNELHYWTVSGPGIPNPTQNTEIATYYVEPGATYNVCQQLLITSSGCNTSECQVITIPDTEAPVCDAAFIYYYQPTNAYLSVNSPYTNAQGSFEHIWEVTSYMNNGTFNTNNQLNVNNNSMFVASNTNALEICHTLTNLNTGCVDSSCQYLDFCSSAYTYAIDTNNQVMTLIAGGVQTLATHTWNIAYHAAGSVYNSEILSGPIATFLLPDGILDMTVCHSVNNTGPYVNCSSYTCDTIVFCNAEFTVIDNGNGTAGIWAVSPPIDGAVYTWNITGPGYPGTAYSGSYFNFTLVPNEPYYVCMAYFNAETGCSASNCDTIVIEGISDTCSAEFTLNYENFILSGMPVTPYTSGNEYAWTINSSNYGAVSYSSMNFIHTLLPDAGEVTVCLNVTNTFLNCGDVYCDTLNLPSGNCTGNFTYTYNDVVNSTDNSLTLEALQPLVAGGNYTWTIFSTNLGTIYNESGPTLNNVVQIIPQGAGQIEVCLEYVNTFTNCEESICMGIESSTCSAEFTYYLGGDQLTLSAVEPIVAGGNYNWLVTSTNLGPLYGSNGITQNFIVCTIPAGAGNIEACFTYTNSITGCADSLCIGIPNEIDSTCTAEIVMGYAPSGWPMFSANGNSTIASYSWILTPYDSNGQALGSGFFSTQNNAYIPAGTTFASIEACLAIITASGCAWNGCATFTAPPDTVISVNCDAFCAFEILPSPDSATAMLVNIFFNGASNSSINNSFVSAITTLSGDTLAMGPENFYAQMGGTQQLYPVYAIDGNTIPNNFNGYVHFSYDNQTCILPYQCLPVCNAAFSWVNNGNNTITATQNGYAPGGQYSWTLTNVVSGQILTYTDSVYITLQLVPGQLYSLCLSYSNEAANCSNSWCAEVSIPQNIPCNADFTYSGPLPINNSYQFIGVPNNDNAYHLWTFGDGASSEQEYPFHAYDTIGVYTVCHIVSVDGVCADTICITIQATENPACTAEIVMGYAPDGWPMFSAIGGSEIATYNWILSPFDSNGIGYNGTYFYSTQNNAYVPAGTEYVGVEGCLSVTFTNGCAWNGCATFTAPPDTANTLPCNALFTFTGPLPVDNNYQFIGVTNDESAYHVWTFSDGTASSQVSPFHAFETTGEYTVCHIVGINGVCADTVCYTGNFIGNSTTGLFIAGEVNAGANVPDNGKVKLYTIDTLSNSVNLVAEYTLSNSGNYIFNGLEAGIYLIKAGLTQSSAWYGDYVPTYFGSQFYWFDAEPVYLTQSGDNYNISLIYAGNGGGPGSVSGNIDDGPFRLMDPESAGVENSNPVAGADVIVTDLSGNPQRWMDADNSGNFNINNLAYGTYRLLADEPGMTCVPIEFTISPEFPSVFIELVMGEDLTGIEANTAITALGEIYPNPAQSNTFIKLNSNSSDDILIQVSSLDGKVIHHVKQSVSGGSLIEIPSSGFAPGMYILQIRSEENALSLTRKLQIVR